MRESLALSTLFFFRLAQQLARDLFAMWDQVQARAALASGHESQALREIPAYMPERRAACQCKLRAPQSEQWMACFYACRLMPPLTDICLGSVSLMCCACSDACSLAMRSRPQ